MGQRTDMQSALDSVRHDMTEAVMALRAALEAERAALDGGDTDALDQAGADKAGRLHVLEELEAERRQLFAELGMAEVSMSLQPAWRSLRDDLAHCHELNKINGAIVARCLSQVRGALAALTGVAEPAATYGPGGHQASPSLIASRLHI